MVYNPEVPEELLIQRCSKAISKAIRQFKALGETIKLAETTEYITTRGIKVTINYKKLEQIHLLVIFDLKSIINDCVPFHLGIGNCCYHDMAIPLHIFTKSQFAVISEECNTIPDFATFLDFHHLMHSKMLAKTKTDPLDVMALLRYHKSDAIKTLVNPGALSIEIDGLWHKYVENNLSYFNEYERGNDPSYVVDELMCRLHQSIGCNMPTSELVRRKMSSTMGTVGNYWQTIELLASLNRLSRRQIGLFILRKIQSANWSEFSYGGIIEPVDKIGFVIVLSDCAREEKTEFLVGVCISFIASNDTVDSVVGFSIGSDFIRGGTLESTLLFRGDEVFSNDVINKSKSLFALPVEVSLDE